jgi:hypothetical protein
VKKTPAEVIASTINMIRMETLRARFMRTFRRRDSEQRG